MVAKLSDQAAVGEQTAESREFLSLHCSLEGDFKTGTKLPIALCFLEEKPIWVVMEIYDVTDPKTGKIKSKKFPINPSNGEAAKSNDPRTLGMYAQVDSLIQRYRKERPDKVYFPAIALSKELGILFVDLDKIRDVDTGIVEAWAQEIVDALGSYTEISQSGKGIHVLGFGKKKFAVCRKGKIEIYDSGRFCTITGDELSSSSALIDIEADVEALADRYGIKEKPSERRAPIQPSLSMGDEEVVRKAQSAANGSRFSALYGGDISRHDDDHSAADLALCSILSFYTDDPSQIDRIFRGSRLYRNKWERADYRENTIAKALQNRSLGNSYVRGVQPYHFSSTCERLDTKIPMTNPSLFTREELKKAITNNECGDAALFKNLCGQDYLYDPDEKLFYIWNGTSWVVDKEKTRYKKLEIIACHYADEADSISAMDEEHQKPHKKFLKDLRDRAKYLKTTRRMSSVLEMATVGAISNGGLTFNGKWDDCTGYLPCANGRIDLKTGKLNESNRNHFIRKYSPIKYDESATCPVFEKFVVEIMGDKLHLAKFLQRLIGYACIGKPIEHIFVFLYGALGRNGKGTFTRTISEVLGHTAREFQSELLLLQRNPPSSGTPRPDLVNLQGTRLALFSEINEGRVVDSAVLKNLSGGDTIAARSLFSNENKNFLPTHTLFMQANYKPKAPAGDAALWRRAVLIPFEMNFVEEPNTKLTHERKIDVHLSKKLEPEFPGILRWIVQGAAEYYREGLAIPEEIRKAVDGYRNENDGIGVFIREKCIRNFAFSTPRAISTKAIQNFCSEEGFNRPSNQEINTRLKQEGFKEYHSSKGDSWIGFSILKEQGNQCDE